MPEAAFYADAAPETRRFRTGRAER